MKKTYLLATIAVLLLLILLLLIALFPRPEGETVTIDSEPDVTNEEQAIEDEEPLTQEEAPFYFTVMTHMEGNFTDDKSEHVFNRHVKQIRYAMELFDEYSAKVTIESEQPFARANEIWGLNIMKEIVDLGHGVGAHCDFGAFDAAVSPEQYAEYYKERKDLVDALVGEEHNKGCSGGNGASDWVLGAYLGGFEYLTGVVGFGLLSMDQSERPDGWTDQAIRSTWYHSPIPIDLLERAYMFRLADATDLEPDEDGVIVINGGSLGEISSLEETREECFPNCVLELADVEVVREAIETVRDQRDVTKVVKLNTHIPVNVYEQKNEEILRAFLEMVQEYVEDGTLEWQTQLGAYEGFLEYESL